MLPRVAICGVLTAGLLLAPSASAQTDSERTLTVTPTSVTAGEPVTLSGSCPPFPDVDIAGNGSDPTSENTFNVLFSVVPQPSGSFSVTLTIPQEASTGSFLFSATCGIELTNTVEVHVEGAGTPMAWTATPDPVDAGSDLHFAGSGCTINGVPGVTALVTLNLAVGDTASRLLQAETTPDSTGAWELTIPIPDDYPSGSATVRVYCVSSTQVSETPLWQRNSLVDRHVRIEREPQAAIVRGDRWFLRLSRTSGPADVEFQYGNPGDRPLFGDWDGDGSRTPAVVRAGWWYERYSNTSGYADNWFQYGDPGDIPISGDWNGDGVDTPGVVRNGVWYLTNSNHEGYADIVFTYGDPGDVPLVGDWDGDGIDTPGVARNPSQWLVRNENTSGSATSVISGCGAERPVPAPWLGDGRTTCGSVANGVWALNDPAHPSFVFGDPGDLAFNWQ